MRQKLASRDQQGGLRFLEEKLSIYVQGSGHSRRNPALDLLTGRVPDQRVQSAVAVAAPSASMPQTLVIPRPDVSTAPRPTAIPAGAALAPSFAAAPSPWLTPPTAEPFAAPRLRFDTVAVPSASPWATLRPLLVPAAAAVILFGGIGLVRGAVDRGSSGLAADGVEPTPVPSLVSETPATLVPFAAGRVELDPAPSRPALTAIMPSPVPADQLRVVLDERFATNEHGWLNVPGGTAWVADGVYHLFARQAGRFVAVGVPDTLALTDVVLSASFRKTGGPAGGGYGLIVRDQATAPRDGQSQAGPFYVFEVGDKGELGVWLRDGDRWIDLLPWTPSDAIHPGTATNELTVSAIGDRLSFLINGIPVASQLDPVLRHGAAGIFVGGDSNQVTVERLTVRVPR